MAKNLESMSDSELLIEIAKGQRKEARSGRISAIAIVVLVIILAVTLASFVGTAVSTLNKVYSTLNEAEKVVISAQDSLEEVNTLVKNFNEVVVDNTDSVSEALGRVKDIDVDSLNKSIEELASILGPLARLFGGN